MLLYKTSYARNEGTEPTTVLWGGSQTEAAKNRKSLKVEFLKPVTETVDVPTNKSGLLDWLNQNCAS